MYVCMYLFIHNTYYIVIIVVVVVVINSQTANHTRKSNRYKLKGSSREGNLVRKREKK